MLRPMLLRGMYGKQACCVEVYFFSDGPVDAFGAGYWAGILMLCGWDALMINSIS